MNEDELFERIGKESNISKDNVRSLFYKEINSLIRKILKSEDSIAWSNTLNGFGCRVGYNRFDIYPIKYDFKFRVQIKYLNN